ncbi:hypothetical protein CONPUDRAFT_113146 [Coniophora puteana RWD-64-598 SS2]|uniref:Zn(2)-C6 fungal-type domain-containing protein n=1 Tax=Coniophora puteana (strain RWD-64-598) TaxID=741705 RepID=R7SFT5_CONPW|nr:uncharacterized protein CONPUDRAFT_113146 [Coniophora puteana RWD-64-598 SS2]EIW74602.1 hypothetical protein CONPUDRAFT_113146 [Coniophora puteana RWD-64-598 SS2]
MQQSNPSNSSSSSPLQWGMACSACRRRKVRCDGGQPVCGRCSRNGRATECHYGDIDSRLTGHVLRREVTQLRARVRELERSSSSVMLQSPYSHPSGSASQPEMRGSADPPSDGGASVSSPSTNFLSPTQITSHDSSDSGEGFRHSQGPAMSSTHLAPPNITAHSSSGSREGSARSHEAQSDSGEELSIAWTTFQAYATSVGWFLNVERFREKTVHQTLTGHSSRALGALVTLWSRVLSSDVIHDSEDGLLHRAQDHLTRASPDVDSSAFVHILQAEILLSYYFLTRARPVDARCHSSIAVSLVCAFSLDRQGAEASNALFGVLGDGRRTLQHTDDVVELGERVHAFWAVFALESSISALLGVPSGLPAFESRISTPWPLEHADYEHLQGTPIIGSSNTDVFSMFSQEQAPTRLTLEAKAAALFQASTALSMDDQGGSGIPVDANYWARCRTLDNLIDNFLLRFSSIKSSPEHHGSFRTVLTSFVLAHAARLRLHHTFHYNYPMSLQKWDDSVKEVAGVLGVSQLPSPLVIHVFASVCSMLQSEVTWSQQGTLHTPAPDPASVGVGEAAPVPRHITLAILLRSMLESGLSSASPVFTGLKDKLERLQAQFIS